VAFRQRYRQGSVEGVARSGRVSSFHFEACRIGGCCFIDIRAAVLTQLENDRTRAEVQQRSPNTESFFYANALRIQSEQRTCLGLIRGKNVHIAQQLTGQHLSRCRI
jgi:hypothetical protein